MLLRFFSELLLCLGERTFLPETFWEFIVHYYSVLVVTFELIDLTVIKTVLTWGEVNFFVEKFVGEEIFN
jgi:hypothetical protein